jgi:hypothetical protein
LLLLGIAIGVTIHLVRLKTYKRPDRGRRLDAQGAPDELGFDAE